MHVAQNSFYNLEILIFFFLNIFANVFFFFFFDSSETNSVNSGLGRTSGPQHLLKWSLL